MHFQLCFKILLLIIIVKIQSQNNNLEISSKYSKILRVGNEEYRKGDRVDHYYSKRLNDKIGTGYYRYGLGYYDGTPSKNFRRSIEYVTLPMDESRIERDNDLSICPQNIFSNKKSSQRNKEHKYTVKSSTQEKFKLYKKNPSNFALDCRFSVRQKSMEFCGVLFTPISFDLKTNDCADFFFMIEDKKFCGNSFDSPKYFTFRNSSINLQIRSNSSSNDSTFNINVMQMKCVDLKKLPLGSAQFIDAQIENLQNIPEEMFGTELFDNRKGIEDIASALTLLVNSMHSDDGILEDGENESANNALVTNNLSSKDFVDGFNRLPSNFSDRLPRQFLNERRDGTQFHPSNVNKFTLEGASFVNNEITTFRSTFRQIKNQENIDLALFSNVNDTADASSSNFNTDFAPELFTTNLGSAADLDTATASFFENIFPTHLTDTTITDTQTTTDDSNSFSTLSGQETDQDISFAAIDLDPGPDYQGHSSDLTIALGPCDGGYSRKDFVIRSVLTHQNSKDASKCTYYVQKKSPGVCQLRLTMDVEIKSNKNACGDEYLEISGKKICGKFTNQILYIVFPSEFLNITFHSPNPQNSSAMYQIRVEQITEGCEELGSTDLLPCNSTVRFDNFTIFSPGHPHFYPNNLVCVTTVRKLHNNITRLLVYFEDFNVESSPNCVKDFVSVGSRKFCGNRNKSTYLLPFQTPTIPITFKTDESGNSRGFQIKVKQIDKLPPKWASRPRCGGVFYSTFVTITSPGFPRYYSPNLQCDYTVVRNSINVCQLRVKIKRLGIERSSGCRKDFLKLGLRRLCGNELEGQLHSYHFSHDNFTLRFQSDAYVGGPGFSLDIEQVKCNTPNHGFTFSEKDRTRPGIITTPSPQISFSPITSTAGAPFTGIENHGTGIENPYGGVESVNPWNIPNYAQKNYTISNVGYHFGYPEYYEHYGTPQYLYPHKHHQYQTQNPPYCKLCQFMKDVKNKKFNILHSLNPFKVVPHVLNHFGVGHQNKVISFHINKMHQNPQNIYTTRPTPTISHNYVPKKGSFIVKPLIPVEIHRDYNPHIQNTIPQNRHILPIYNEGNNNRYLPPPGYYRETKSYENHPPDIQKTQPQNTATLGIKPVKNPLSGVQINSHQLGINVDSLSPKNPSQVSTSYIYHPNIQFKTNKFNPADQPSTKVNQAGQSNTRNIGLTHNIQSLIQQYPILQNPSVQTDIARFLNKSNLNNCSNKNTQFKILGSNQWKPIAINQNSKPERPNFQNSGPFIPNTPIELNSQTNSNQFPNFVHNSIRQNYLDQPNSLNPSPINQQNSQHKPYNNLNSHSSVSFSTIPLQSGINNQALGQSNQNSCGRSISMSRFQILRSEDYLPTQKNMHCVYHVYRNGTDRCGLLVRIHSLSLPYDKSCTSNFLRIAGSKFCGQQRLKRQMVMPFKENENIEIKFHLSVDSKNSHEKFGFSLIGQQIKCAQKSTSKDSHPNPSSDIFPYGEPKNSHPNPSSDIFPYGQSGQSNNNYG